MSMNELVQFIKSDSYKKPMSYYFDYFSFKDTGQHETIKRSDILFKAWARTGKHLRKALNEYGEETSQKPNHTSG